MKRPSKQVTSIGVVAVIIGLAAAGISTFSMAGANPIVVFLIVAILVLIAGFALDRAARNALSGRR